MQLPAKFVYSDAINHACSSFIDNDHKIFHQNWSPAESSKSSFWRELRKVDLVPSAFALELQGKKVACFTDNTSVVRIVHNGSKVTELQSLALSIFNVCARHGISLEIKWIPRSFNYQADLLSRTIDFDNYTIHDDVFRMLDCQWRPHTVDRFACSYNARFCVTIPGSTSLARKLSTLSPKTGTEKTTGFFLRSRKLVEVLLMLEQLRP